MKGHAPSPPPQATGAVRRRAAVVLALLLAALPASAYAQLTAQALVDRTAITPQDVVQLTVTVSGGDAEVDTSGIQDFQVQSRGQSSSIQMVNARVTRETRYHYGLTPLRAGTLAIPSLPVRGDGEEAWTDPIEVTVRPADASRGEEQDLVLRARVSNPAPFLGEELVYTLQLETAVPLYNATYREPEFPGFLVRKLDDQRTASAVRNGREVRVTEIVYLLTPRQVGDLQIGPATLSCQVPAPEQPRQRRDPFAAFDDPFFRRSRTVEKTLRSAPLTVAVRPLPEPPADVRFSGLVGRFALSGALTPPALAAGDSATLTLVLEGRGNVEEAQPPVVDPPQGFKTYPDNPEAEVVATPRGSTGSKRFRFALVPTRAGEYRLGPFRVDVFDTGTGGYRTLEAGPFPLQVTPGAGGTADGASPPGDPHPLLQPKRRVEQRGEDILDIHRNLGAVEPRTGFAASTLAALFAGPPLAYLTLSLVGAARRRERSAAERMTRRVKLLLSDASAACEGGRTEEVSGLLQRALTAAVLARAGRDGELLTYREAESLLTGLGLDHGTVARTVGMLQRLDEARYGGSLAEAQAADLLDRCRALVRELERRGERR